MSTTVIVGAQCGDEGKGKVVDYFSKDKDLVIRFQGGDNAGHTVANEFGTFKLHLVPCGIFNSKATCLVGTGMVVNPIELKNEMDQIAAAGVPLDGLKISSRAHILMPYHRDLDSLKEQSGKAHIGTTKRGIGPAYAGKASRINIRFGDLADKEYLRNHFESVLEQINSQLEYYNSKTYTVDEVMEYCKEWYDLFKDRIVDAFALIQTALKNNKKILFEGQLGIMKDIDLGTYPYVTSSNPVAAYAAVSAGIPARSIDRIIGVAKAFSSQVGDGPFPTEVFDERFDTLRGTGANIDDEFGARTGRPRRLGWLDIPVLRFANMVNGFDELVLCKLDKLDELDELEICVDYKLNGKILEIMPETKDLDKVEAVYEKVPGWKSSTKGIKKFEDLPQNAKNYIKRIEELVGVPVNFVGVGPERDDIAAR